MISRYTIQLLFTLLFSCLFPITETKATVLQSGKYSPEKFLSTRIQAIYNHTNSLIDDEANDITQTTDGYIWIASYRGLLRFDGNRFEVISEKKYPVFDSRSCRSLLATQSGELYIGTNDNGLFVLKDNTMRKITTGAGVSSLIRELIESEGKIYALTAAGLAVISDNTLVKVPTETDHNYFVCGTADGEGKIYVVNNKDELILIDPASGESQTIDINGKHARAVAIDQEKGTLYVAVEGDQLQIHHPDRQEIEVITTPGTGRANCLFLDNKKRVWIPGENGVGFIDAKHRFHSLAINNIKTDFRKIWQDYEGNHWIASSTGGVIKISKSKFCDIFYDNDLAKSLVYTTAIIDDTLYIGTNHGLKILKGKKFLQHDIIDKTKGIRIRGLLVDSGKNLWVCTYGRGLFKVKDNRIIAHWTKEDGLPINKVRAIKIAADGTAYIATTAGVAVLQKGKITRVIDGLKNDFILSLTTTSKNTLFIGSDGGGVFRLSDQGISVINQKKDKLKSDVILRTFYDEESSALFLSSGALQIQLPDKTIKTISRDLIEGEIFDIRTYKNDLILITSQGLLISPIKEVLTKEHPQFKAIKKIDGLNSIPTANSWSALTKSGDLYIATMEGVLYINIANIPYNNTAPKITLNSIVVDTENISPGTTAIELDSDTQTIIFNPAVLSFKAAQENEIIFQLKGFDQHPKRRKLAETSTIAYSNLNGGEYTFYLSGVNAEGVISKKRVEIRIRKNLTLLERPVTYIVMALLLIIFTFLLVNLFYRKKRRILIQEKDKYKEITVEAIEVISHTIDAKDAYTRGHSQRVANYSVLIGQRIGLEEKELEKLYYTALVHDIGKISIPDAILNKTGKLSDEEYEMMRSHAYKGYLILKDFKQLGKIWIGALFHHERWDGKGYPNEVVGEDIPLYGRIISVADSYDAMASERPYRKGLPQEIILDELKKGKNTQFEESLVNIMITLIEEGAISEINSKTSSYKTRFSSLN